MLDTVVKSKMSTVRVQETDRQELIVQGAVINKGLSIGANLEF